MCIFFTAYSISIVKRHHLFVEILPNYLKDFEAAHYYYAVLHWALSDTDSDRCGSIIVIAQEIFATTMVNFSC